MADISIRELNETELLAVMRARSALMKQFPQIASTCFAFRIATSDDTGAYTFVQPAGKDTLVVLEKKWMADGLHLPTVLIHEALHYVLAHTKRMVASVTPDTACYWWMAEEAVINSIVQEGMKLPMPASAITLASIVEDAAKCGVDLDGKLGSRKSAMLYTTEELYMLLMAAYKEPRQKDDGKDGSTEKLADGDKNGSGDSGEESLPGRVGEQHQGHGKMKQELEDSDGEEDEEDAAQAAISRAVVQTVINELAELVSQATGIGTGSLGISKQFVYALPPAPNPREILKEYIRKLPEQTWRRIHRRAAGYGIILPSYHDRKEADVWIVIDVSGSTFENQTRFLSWVVWAVESLGITVHVVYHDTEILLEEDVYPGWKNARTEMPTGGGTDFTCVFRRVLDGLGPKEKQPEKIVWLTDGAGYNRYKNDIRARALHILWFMWPMLEDIPKYAGAVNNWKKHDNSAWQSKEG